MKKDIIEIAIKAGIDASAAVMDIYENGFDVYKKEDHSPVTDADLASSKIIEDRLSQFNIPVISEENDLPPYSSRKQFDKYFLIDPLDGTKEFVGKTGEFCINIAFVENNVPTLGLIFEPVSKTVLFGGDFSQDVIYSSYNYGSGINESSEVKNSNAEDHSQELRLICSRRADVDRLKKSANELFNAEKIEIKTKGSALKFIDLALSKADIYLRHGKTMEWDIAPGFALLKYLNGSIVHLDKDQDLHFNKENLLNPPFIAYKKKFNE